MVSCLVRQHLAGSRPLLGSPVLVPLLGADCLMEVTEGDLGDRRVDTGIQLTWRKQDEAGENQEQVEAIWGKRWPRLSLLLGYLGSCVVVYSCGTYS